MRFARDFNGLLVDAEIIKTHGNYICPLCHNLAHWRKMSVNYRRPHFYHAKANEDCQLSVIGGEWTLQENDNVLFVSSESNKDKFTFPRQTKPNLSKIPLEFTSDSESTKQISPTIMKIRFSSSDVAQIDHTISLFYQFVKKQETISFLAIPLPVRVLLVQGGESSTKRIHRRLGVIIGSTPELLERLSLIEIPENVEISIHFPKK